MRVLILDANARVRGALQDVFEAELNADVTAGASIAAASRLSRTPPVDVAVVDEHLAGAISNAARLHLEKLSRLAPVVVMGLGERALYEDVHVAAGAVGYWPKDGDLDALLALVRATGLVQCADRACAESRRLSAGPSQQRRAQRRIGAAA